MLHEQYACPLASLSCFASYHSPWTLVVVVFKFLFQPGGYQLFLCIQKFSKKAQVEYFIHSKFPMQKRNGLIENPVNGVK